MRKLYHRLYYPFAFPVSSQTISGIIYQSTVIVSLEHGISGKLANIACKQITTKLAHIAFSGVDFPFDKLITQTALNTFLTVNRLMICSKFKLIQFTFGICPYTYKHSK